MAVITVGGHSHNIGKSALVAALMEALPEYGWTAMKITHHDPGVCPVGGGACNCGDKEHRYCIQEEYDPLATTDSSRFLAAGAARSYWVQVKHGQFGSMMCDLQRILGSGLNSVIESNSILGYLKPDLYLVVLRPAVTDWKVSARAFLERADAAVVTGKADPGHRWEGIPNEILEGLPTFFWPAPGPLPEALIALARSRLTASEPRR